VLVPKLATPNWDAIWNGDPESIWLAAEAASTLLKQAGIPFVTSIEIDWGQGVARETTVEEARGAMRFAQPPESVQVMLLRQEAETDPADWISTSIFASRNLRIRLYSTGADFDQTERIFGAARKLLETSEQGEITMEDVADSADPQQVAEDSPPQTLLVPIANESDARQGFLGWVESHVGLITLVVGVLAIVAAVLIAITTR
jgi:hypothetical protein